MMQGGQGPQGAKQREQHAFSWNDHVLRLTEAEFKLRYRLDFDAFKELLRVIGKDLEVSNPQKAVATKGYAVDCRVKLAIALRFLAGGSPLDLRLIYYVSKSYVYDCTWLVIDAINRHLKIEFPIDDVEKLSVLEAEWRSRASCPEWSGQVAALDGVHFAVLGPSAADVIDPLRYFVARKDKYALLCMALCDAERRVLWFDISQVPTTHDSLDGSHTQGRRRSSRPSTRPS